MPLIDILQDGQTAIEIVAEISHRDPETDAESVTYISRHGTVPATGPSDTPANQTFPARLLSVGPFRESLSEDLLFSGLSGTELGNLVVNNTPTTSPPAPGPYDSWLDLSFAGFDVTFKVGAQGALYSTFETVAIGTSNGNPVFQGNEITIALQSVFSKLDIPLIVNRNVGIPTCLRSLNFPGIVTVTRVAAAHDLVRFTGFIMFRSTAAPSAAVRLHAKIVSGTDINWMTRLLTSGFVEFTTSSGGVVSTITNSVNLCDGEWHRIVFARNDATTAYLMVDDLVIGTVTPSGSTDLSVANIQFALRSSGSQDIDMLDARLYSSYLSPDEARAVTPSRVEGSETGLVGAWRMDDGSGSTVTDYSPTAQNGSIGGTINVDFSWEPSDLGLPEQTGLPMPVVYGDVFNAPLDLIDSTLERHRWHDGLSDAPSTYNAALTVKVRGVPITEGVDWDHQPDVSTGVIETTSEIDQPATFDTTVDTPGSYPNAVVEFLLVDRGGFNNATRSDWLDAMSYLFPSPSGVFVKGSDRTLGTVVGEYLTGIGGHLRLDTPSGKFIPSHLLPTMGPSPVNVNDPVLEFVGSTDDLVDFGNIANPTSSMSVACWFKSYKGLQDSMAGSYSLGALIDKATFSQGYRLIVNSTGGVHFSVSGVGSITSASFIVKPDKWYFIMGVFDDTANTQEIFLAEDGLLLTSVASATGRTGTPVVSSIGLYVGNSPQALNLPHLGSIAHAQVWSKAHTLAQAQTLMDQFEAGTPLVGNEANLLFYPPINDGVGSTTVTNLVGPTTGTISGLCRWAPQLVLDFTTAQPNGSIDSLARMIPAGDIEIRYHPNHLPMQQSDIAASVSDPDSLALRLPYLSLKPNRVDIKADFAQTRSIVVSSPFLEKSAAVYLYTLLSSRFGPDNLIVRVSGISRDAMLLSLTDEVRIKGAHEGLSTGVNFRVVDKFNSWTELTTSLVLALGKLD